MQSTYMGKWGPGGPVVLVTTFVVFGQGCLMAAGYSGSCVRNPCVAIFEGCFLDLRLLLLCIGVWPCRTFFVDFMFFELLPSI